MYCRNCAREISPQAVICVGCGVPPAAGKKYCQNCAQQTDPSAEICIKCGVRLAVVPTGPGQAAKSRMAAGLLGIFLGCLGIHRFYLGYTGIGLVQLLVSVIGGALTCGIATCGVGVWGLVEGILLLTGSLDRDASGKPLRD